MTFDPKSYVPKQKPWDEAPRRVPRYASVTPPASDSRGAILVALWQLVKRWIGGGA